MGMLSALALQDEELGFTLEQQVAMHLATNCYPPVPSYMVEPAIEALDVVNDGIGGMLIELPAGVEFRGKRFATGFEIVESLRLGAWVIESELD